MGMWRPRWIPCAGVRTGVIVVGWVVVPFELFFAEHGVDLIVTVATDHEDAGFHLFPGEHAFIALLAMPGAGDEVMPGQLLLLPFAQFARSNHPVCLRPFNRNTSGHGTCFHVIGCQFLRTV